MTTTVIIRDEKILPAVTWAGKNFGFPNFKFELMFPAEICKFYFTNESDAVHFSLKWS